MSLKAMTWAMEDSGVTNNSQWSVLMVLANRANNDEPTCFPGQEVIAKEARLSVRTVRTALAALEEGGLITRQERRRADGSRTSDLYRLNINRQMLPVAEESPANNAGVTGNGCRGVPAMVAGQEPVSLNQEENLEGARETSPVKLTGDYPAPRKTLAPDVFPITDRMRIYAALMAPSVAITSETEMFLGHHRSNGSRFVNWYSAWQKWVVKAHTWEVARGWKPAERIERVF